MSRRSSILLLTMLVAGVVSAQWLADTILLPDSLGGVRSPFTIVRNSVNNTILIADAETPTAVVLDCPTGQRISRKVLPQGVSTACHDSVRNRYYCVGQVLIVLDGASCEVLRYISLPTMTSNMVCCNQTSGKV